MGTGEAWLGRPGGLGVVRQGGVVWRADWAWLGKARSGRAGQTRAWYGLARRAGVGEGVAAGADEARTWQEWRPGAARRGRQWTAAGGW